MENKLLNALARNISILETTIDFKYPRKSFTRNRIHIHKKNIM